ncbi:MAG: hypothetical protein KDC97_13330, partial [Confluentibacter sp.]|nr:hypothetical protein [Confluentibacter sp.]
LAPTLPPLPVPSMARTTSPTGAGTRSAKPETRGERRKTITKNYTYIYIVCICLYCYLCTLN